MTTVILAEKVSQQTDYAKAFKESTRKTGYYEVLDKDLINDDKVFITSGFGHLIQLEEPQAYDEKFKKWNIEDLPIIPNDFKYKVTDDKGIKKQFKIVKGLIDKADTIIIATDIDREGELIARLIINQCRPKNNVMIKRLFINSNERDVVRKGFKDLINASERINVYKEALTRQHSDWLVGINLTRFYTNKINDKNVYPVGRVQTPTLSLLYNRELEIKNFTPKTYFELEAITKDDVIFKNTTKINDTNELKEIFRQYRIKKETTGIVKDIEYKDKSNSAPKLFNLSDLQIKANNELKISASETLATIQSLYEKKFLSYPRTACNYITESEFNYLNTIADELAEFLSLNQFTKINNQPRKKYVDSSKVEEHYAIIPTKNIPKKEYEKFNKNEKWCYETVVKRTLAIFMEDHKYQSSTMTLDINDLLFQINGKIIKENGYKDILTDDKKEDNILPNYQKGEKLDVTINPVTKTTKPPKPYNEATLIKAMINAGNDESIEDSEDKKILKEVKGIGTEATRANVIETLLKQQYMKNVKNNLEITDKGRLLCETVKNTPLSSAKMTADWEKYLSKIGTGEGKREVFIANIEKLLNKIIA
ncbi:DNA topoisomerase III (plasmid) [Macrococcoides bohemicum]|uniref:DNA topoisomerase n=1 Tax=Macrococcoides bohemicum TaxID=1903056 RepID=A0A327ZZY3_9STAP|nr:DNA topoisomerase III [Macrococcus bohemicus]RAK47840.1 DNA topoisomerase III [Macrococcus bohemicus]